MLPSSCEGYGFITVPRHLPSLGRKPKCSPARRVERIHRAHTQPLWRGFHLCNCCIPACLVDTHSALPEKLRKRSSWDLGSTLLGIRFNHHILLTNSKQSSRPLFMTRKRLRRNRQRRAAWVSELFAGFFRSGASTFTRWTLG